MRAGMSSRISTWLLCGIRSRSGWEQPRSSLGSTPIDQEQLFFGVQPTVIRLHFHCSQSVEGA